MLRYLVSLILVGGFVAANAVAQGGPTVSFGHVVWSPDGKMIAFTRMEVTNSTPRTMVADIYVARADGSQFRRLTGTNGNESFPSFSPDGKTVFFGSGAPRSREQEIFSVSVKGGGLRLIARAPGRDGAPVVSPDGKRIVFNSERDGGLPQIYVMNIDGSDPKRLSDDDKVAFYNPVWSPDGRRIVYYREIRDNKDQIWSMNADGSDKKLLTNNIGHNFYPSWSANGKRVIFTRMTGEEQEIFSMNADGTDLKPLNIKGFFARESPDGKRIAFIRGGQGRMGLFVKELSTGRESELFK